VNYNHVFMGLGLYGLRAGDTAAVEAAERMVLGTARSMGIEVAD
jgi:hypothetical protein